MSFESQFLRLKERELSALFRGIEGDTGRLIEAVISNTEEESALFQLGETMNGNEFTKLKRILKGSAFQQIKLSLSQHRQREEKEGRENKER